MEHTVKLREVKAFSSSEVKEYGLVNMEGLKTFLKAGKRIGCVTGKLS